MPRRGETGGVVRHDANVPNLRPLVLTRWPVALAHRQAASTGIRYHCRMGGLLPPTVSARILVVGDFMVDRYWFGDTVRVSQEAPVPVVDVADVEDRPGGAANVALNIATLGARCVFVAAVGRDAAARGVRKRLEAAGVECDFVEVPAWQTTLKIRVVSQRQQLLRADVEAPLPESVSEAVQARVAARLPDVDAVILEDYDKGVLAAPEALVECAKAAGVTVLVDPKHKPFTRYAGADVIKPNRREFQRAVGTWRDEAELAAKGEAVLERTGAGALVVTQGSDGLTVVRREGGASHVSGHDVQIYDRTGAGDTVAAALGVGIGLGWDLMEAARMANAAAGLVCAKSGTASVSGAEVNRALADGQASPSGSASTGGASPSGSSFLRGASPSRSRGRAVDCKGRVLTSEELLAAVAAARGRGERIVFTNGCFDIVHPGHVGYLEEARRLGDRLIVAVNDDASAKRVKGVGRPVNPLRSRMGVLAHLGSVDWVVPFSEDTPEQLLAAVRPDVLVKGGDYAEREIVGAGLVREYGGEVRALSRFEGCSTSSIIRRINGG